MLNFIIFVTVVCVMIGFIGYLADKEVMVQIGIAGLVVWLIVGWFGIGMSPDKTVDVVETNYATIFRPDYAVVATKDCKPVKITDLGHYNELKASTNVVHRMRYNSYGHKVMDEIILNSERAANK